MKMNRRSLLAGSAGLATVPLLGSQVLGARVRKKMPKDGVTLIAEVQAKPGEEAAVKKALVAMVEPTREEDGCFCYNLHQQGDDKARFMFYEQWKDQDALDKHMQTEHMKTLQAALDGKIEGIKATKFALL